jgi:hypothetical protein
MWRHVVLMWTDVSEERVASVFGGEKSANEEPAWAVGCRLSCVSKTVSSIRTGREEEWAMLPLPSPHYWFPMWPTLAHFLSLHSWLFLTGSPVCSHLLTLIPHSQIFLPWRWRQRDHPKREFTQELHGAISQKTTFFNTLFCFHGNIVTVNCIWESMCSVFVLIIPCLMPTWHIFGNQIYSQLVVTSLKKCSTLTHDTMSCDSVWSDKLHSTEFLYWINRSSTSCSL